MVKWGDETDCRARHEMERPLGCVLTSIGHWIFKIRHPAHQFMISSHSHHELMITLLGLIQFISWPPNHSRSPPAPQPRFFVTPLALSKGNLHFFQSNVWHNWLPFVHEMLIYQRRPSTPLPCWNQPGPAPWAFENEKIVEKCPIHKENTRFTFTFFTHSVCSFWPLKSTPKK